MQAFIVQHTDDVTEALAGGPLADCPGDLAACEAAPRGQRLKTGQAACYDDAGIVIPCAGTGQDGEVQAGLSSDFVDNGDGTITDQRTGLMWEKLSDDGSIHDKDDLYTWSDAFASKVATLNSTAFAGYSDWRLPNVNEVQGIMRYGSVNPALDTAFNNGCVTACTVLTCSCTRSVGYWTSTTYQWTPNLAWLGQFYAGLLDAGTKSSPYCVRAVRGGL
jgi:hypothetical protein